MLWKEEYALGVEHIDKQHKGLFDVTGRILRILADGDSARNRRTCKEAIKYLKDYALSHFADEEEYQRSIGYARYHQHKQRHEQFAKNIVRMEQEMEEQGYSPESVQQFIRALTSWLVNHIMCSDQDIVGRACVDYGEQADDPADLLQQAVLQEGKDQLGQGLVLLDGEDFSGERFLVLEAETTGGQLIRAIVTLDIAFTLHLTETALENLFGQAILQFAGAQYGEGQITQAYHMKNWEITPFVPQESPLCSLQFQSSYGMFAIRVWLQS